MVLILAEMCHELDGNLGAAANLFRLGYLTKGSFPNNGLQLVGLG
jgi:hypothetical protein